MSGAGRRRKGAGRRRKGAGRRRKGAGRRRKVLLLGPNGQLGRDIRKAHANADAPFDLFAVGRDRLDVSQPAAIAQVLADVQFDILVNCTGYHRTDEAEDNAALAVAVNAHAVAAMAKLCAHKRARLLHISTDYVFGGDVERRQALREDDPIAPVNVYGASKALGETLARLAHEDVVILRVASLFGVAGASGKGGNFVETMIRLGREGRTLRVVDDQIMSPTATADVADIAYRMLCQGCPSGPYHVVNSGTASWYGFATEIFRQTALEATVTPCASAEYPTRAQRPSFSALDNAKTVSAIDRLRPWQDALDAYLVAKGHRRSAP